MATKKKPSSGLDTRSKRIVKKKMETVMHEFKHHELESGNTGKKVRNPKQAIAIGLSEARRSGADIPPSPNKGKKAAGKKAGAKKAAPKRTTSKKQPAKKKAPGKSTAKAPARKPAKKTSSKRSR